MTLEQIKQRANAGDRRAQCVLGKRYELGLELRKNPKQALQWYEKSAEQGFIIAQMRLADMYNAMYLDDKLEDNDEAMHWFREAAKRGHPSAQVKVAEELEDSDPQEAFDWMHQAAVAGDALAQHKLAEYYEQGTGIPKNGSEAFRWYLSEEQTERSQNNNYGSYDVGRCYALGLGVQKDCDEALKRLLPIANPRTTESLLEMASAQACVAAVYIDAESQRRDLVEGYDWCSLAAIYACGWHIMSRDAAAETRDAIEKQLTKQQLQQAQSRAQELFVPEKDIYKRLGSDVPQD
jgi:TPR repeat protein